jgi:hypothetical protein
MAVVEGCEGISIASTHEHHQVLVREVWVAYLVVPSRHLPSTSRIFERRWFSSRGPSNRGSPQCGGLTDQAGPCSERRSSAYPDAQIRQRLFGRYGRKWPEMCSFLPAHRRGLAGRPRLRPLTKSEGRAAAWGPSAAKGIMKAGPRKPRPGVLTKELQ